ncbi:helix-turn-helix transcriptional regulator [Daejeonella oryzae]|uniref:helix-turn-helix transcriptional regulator n=1 Tax=Daejeonella oryzae TaxID=1122943 RepID=UPI0003FEDA96|nr:LuxR C-terminal-related transcriptional regulator [Daejeonella oryzae]
MNVFGTEMLLVTCIFALLEIVMFFYQFIHYLSRPEEKQRLYYLILLFLLIVYNISGGLFPDPKIDIPVVAQNIIAYGSGFLMASYFPYYFYKGFDLIRLRFHALYGVLLFLILPFVIFFVIVYSIQQSLDFAIKFGIIIPFFYSIVLLWAIMRAIRLKYRDHKSRGNFMEVVAVYLAVIPWVMMTPIAYFDLGQLIEVLCTNGGFVVISILFISKSISRSRLEYQRLMELNAGGVPPILFMENCFLYKLTNREIEIVKLLRQGKKYQLIAEKLFISEFTVKKHVHNIFQKTEVNNKVELVHKLDQQQFFQGNNRLRQA